MLSEAGDAVVVSCLKARSASSPTARL